MNAPFDPDRFEQTNLSEYYETLFLAMLRAFRRNILFIVSIVVGAIAVASLIVVFLPRKYTAEALVHPELFFRAEGKEPAFLANVAGPSLAASEAQLIESDAMVRAVVRRLQREHEGILDVPAAKVGAISGTIRSWLLPESHRTTAQDKIVASVTDSLLVSRDSESYVITIAFTSSDPEKAALVANTFALEYLKLKRLRHLGDVTAAANRTLARQLSKYGSKHPSVIGAQAELRVARAMSEQLSSPASAEQAETIFGEGVTMAQIADVPSSPNGTRIIGLTALLSFAFAVALAIRRDRNTGFDSAPDVAAFGGQKCIGLLPNFGAEKDEQTFGEFAHRMHTITMDAGLLDAGIPSRVVLISSAVSCGTEAQFAETMTVTLASAKRRVLTFMPATVEERDFDFDDDMIEEIELELDVALNNRKMLARLNEHKDKSVIVRLPTESWSAKNVASARAVSNFMKTARKRFDTVLIVTPPITESADALLLGHVSDLAFFLSGWKETPRRIVRAALHKLRDRGMHNIFVVLTNVDPETFRKLPN